jgi:hypothetical protein
MNKIGHTLDPQQLHRLSLCFWGRREHHRSRSHRHLRAYTHGRSDHVDWKRIGSFAAVYGECSRSDVTRHHLGKGSAGSRRSLAPRADAFVDLGIDILFSRGGRLGTRMIRVSTNAENCASTVGTVGVARTNGSSRDHRCGCSHCMRELSRNRHRISARFTDTSSGVPFPGIRGGSHNWFAANEDSITVSLVAPIFISRAEVGLPPLIRDWSNHN